MLSMLVVLVIVERPQAHTGTLRGLRRRLFSSRFGRDAIRGHAHRMGPQAQHAYARKNHHRAYVDAPGPSKIFRLRRALFTKKHIRFLHLMGAGPEKAPRRSPHKYISYLPIEY